MAEWSLADSWAGLGLLFLAFCCFLGGALGYARAVRAWLFPQAEGGTKASDIFLLASALLWGVAALLASLHLLRAVPGWLLGAAFLPGLFLLRPAGAWLRGIWDRGFAATAVFAFVLLVRGLSAAFPASHGDPLLYHLLGPRLWAEAGGFVMHPLLPNALLASSWECLYLWPQLFWLSPVPLFGLVEAQLFSQWLHLFLAWGGCGLLVARIFRGHLRAGLLPWAALAAMTVAGVQWPAALAKNDLGIAFWVLGSVACFFEGFRESSRARLVFSGLLAGLALSGKITALLSLAPLLGILLLSFRPWREPLAAARKLAAWGAGCFLGAFPIYARNYVFSGNPFFPLFPRLFPSPYMSENWARHFSQVQPASPLHALPSIWGRLPELLRESPWAVSALLFLAWLALVPLLPPRARVLPGLRQSGWIVAGAALAYALFVTTQGKDIELRYLGASLMLLAGGGTGFLLSVVELIPSARARAAGTALFCIALLAGSKLPTHLLWKAWKGPLGTKAVLTHGAGEAKAWVRAHAGGGITVLVSENETYYLTPVPVTVLTEHPALDAAASSEKDLRKFLEKVCGIVHPRFLLDSRPPIGLAGQFGAAALAPGQAFAAQGAVVYDVPSLARSLRPAVAPCL